MKKVAITEDDAYRLSLRYSPTTVLSLLNEVWGAGGRKIDWNALVEKTETGITNAREYQMVWRHVAYQHPLLDKIEEGAEPLDDDSDLEIELEVVPPVIDDALRQAKECVRMMAENHASRRLGSTEKRGLESPLAERGVDKEMLDASPDKQPPQTSHAVATSTLQEKLTQPTGAPIVGGIEQGLDEAAEGVVGGVQHQVFKKQRLGDGADETPTD